MFSDKKTLRALSAALKPDNVDFPKGMNFSQRTRGKDLMITISLDSRNEHQFETLIFTLDEIISHAQSAVSAIEKTENL